MPYDCRCISSSVFKFQFSLFCIIKRYKNICICEWGTITLPSTSFFCVCVELESSFRITEATHCDDNLDCSNNLVEKGYPYTYGRMSKHVC